MTQEKIIRPNAHGVPSVRGTRLTVYSIMDEYFSGETPEKVANFFGISADDAQNAVDYINEHMVELMPEYRAMLERDRAGNSADVEAKLADSRHRLIQLQSELHAKKGLVADAPIAG